MWYRLLAALKYLGGLLLGAGLLVALPLQAARPELLQRVAVCTPGAQHRPCRTPIQEDWRGPLEIHRDQDRQRDTETRTVRETQRYRYGKLDQRQSYYRYRHQRQRYRQMDQRYRHQRYRLKIDQRQRLDRLELQTRYRLQKEIQARQTTDSNYIFKPDIEPRDKYRLDRIGIQARQTRQRYRLARLAMQARDSAQRW